MKYKTTYDLTHITSLEALRREQLVVQARIEDREHELRLKLYEMPAEIAAAGANSLIPKFLRGKITNAALNGGKRLINNLDLAVDNGFIKVYSKEFKVKV